MDLVHCATKKGQSINTLQCMHLYYQMTLTDKSCICYTCYKRCERNKTNKLKRDLVKTPKLCQIESCNKVWHTNWNLTCVSEVESFLEARLSGFQVDESGTTVGVCKDHSNKLYTRDSTLQCAFCETKHKGSTIVNRKCPEPDKVNAYFQQILPEGGLNITPGDYICDRL